jgi:hypothetical protein
VRDACLVGRVETDEERAGKAPMGLRWRMDVRPPAIDAFNPTKDGTMKSQLRGKAIVATLAALCVWSGQASAIDARDGIFNCRIRSMSNADGTGTSYWLKVNGTSGQTGTITYTTDSTQATRFTFTRKDTWKHDSGGTAYYLTAAPLGNCVGLANAVTPGIGTLVTTNWSCTETNQKRIVIESRNSTAFVMRVQSNGTTLWFDGWGGLANGNQIKLNTAQNGGNFGLNQIFYTNGCRNSDNNTYRPKAGT